MILGCRCKWAQVGGPKWVGPRRAHVGGPTPGPSGWAQAGPKWAQARNLGPTKIQKIKILKIKIRSAQNVGKVWISRNKILLAPFGSIPGHFFHGPEKCKKCTTFCLFFLVGQWALFTRFGPLLLSTRGGAIGNIIVCVFQVMAHSKFPSKVVASREGKIQ